MYQQKAIIDQRYMRRMRRRGRKVSKAISIVMVSSRAHLAIQVDENLH
jgi:hypothetical protein